MVKLSIVSHFIFGFIFHFTLTLNAKCNLIRRHLNCFIFMERNNKVYFFRIPISDGIPYVCVFFSPIPCTHIICASFAHRCIYVFVWLCVNSLYGARQKQNQMKWFQKKTIIITRAICIVYSIQYSTVWNGRECQLM